MTDAKLLNISQDADELSVSRWDDVLTMTVKSRISDTDKGFTGGSIDLTLAEAEKLADWLTEVLAREKGELA